MKKLLLIVFFSFTTQVQPMQRAKEFAKKTTAALTAGVIGLKVGHYCSPTQRLLRQGDQAAQTFYEDQNKFYKTREEFSQYKKTVDKEFDAVKAEYDQIMKNSKN